MTIYLKLFLTFLEVGAVSFGGGYGMISLIRELVLSYGWLTEEELLNFIAVAESTPGPIAINMATFIGSSQAGIVGSALATLGVVLPSFVIILIIVVLIKNLLKYEAVKAFLGGIRPCVVALIVATAVTMGLNSFFELKNLPAALNVNFRAIIIGVILVAVAALSKLILKKKPSPIIMIIISAGLGMLVYAV